MPFAAVFRLICMFVLSFVFGTFAAAYLIRFFYLDYSKQKTFWEFRVFLAPLQKRSIFLLFVFSLFLIFWINYRKRKQKRKSLFLGCFCPKTSVFVANKTLIFSDLYLYRVIYTPPPVLGTRRVGQLSSEIFYFFIFYFFCKILRFYQFSFSTEF